LVVVVSTKMSAWDSPLKLTSSSIASFSIQTSFHFQLQSMFSSALSSSNSDWLSTQRSNKAKQL
jgi:hypothetical protein